MGPAGLHHMQLELDATRYILTLNADATYFSEYPRIAIFNPPIDTASYFYLQTTQPLAIPIAICNRNRHPS